MTTRNSLPLNPILLLAGKRYSFSLIHASQSNAQIFGKTLTTTNSLSLNLILLNIIFFPTLIFCVSYNSNQFFKIIIYKTICSKMNIFYVLFNMYQVTINNYHPWRVKTTKRLLENQCFTCRFHQPSLALQFTVNTDPTMNIMNF